jgi:hypothetical protein
MTGYYGKPRPVEPGLEGGFPRSPGRAIAASVDGPTCPRVLRRPLADAVGTNMANLSHRGCRLTVRAEMDTVGRQPNTSTDPTAGGRDANWRRGLFVFHGPARAPFVAQLGAAAQDAWSQACIPIISASRRAVRLASTGLRCLSVRRGGGAAAGLDLPELRRRVGLLSLSPALSATCPSPDRPLADARRAATMDLPKRSARGLRDEEPH